MSKQSQTAPAAAATKTQQTKPAPPTVQDLVAAPEVVGPISMTGIASPQAAANRLGHPQLPRIQRQMMAGRIGQQQGNGNMQQVLAFVRGAQQHAPYQSNKGYGYDAAPNDPLGTMTSVYTDSGMSVQLY
ncbi:MAG: hypothetical protein KDE31_10670, partial [Caldilineaceae bacterium]|nr:hypothetical protein [Caldilineaceae bacterium]